MNPIRVLYAGDGETLNYLVSKGLIFYAAGGHVDESGNLAAACAGRPVVAPVNNIKKEITPRQNNFAKNVSNLVRFTINSIAICRTGDSGFKSQHIKSKP